ncbi:MAG: PKD domain-containing protein [Bacteroidetes bacterium]|nr:PKD domain-containing protein [Bacteroidota bacterium]
MIPGTGQEISPVCPSEVTTCNGGTFTGIQEYVYRGVITLPGPCADWQFSYNLCCRNNAITNLVGPGQTQMYIFSTLNNMAAPCNNSPIFSNKPVPFVCLGQQFCFNHGAYDQDGDVLVYSLMTPYDSPGTPVTYSTGFSPSNPLSSSPALSFNSSTGDICMTPTNLEVTVMAVLVQEYRNGVLIGSVERDIQITVINCTNVIPTLTGINGTNSFSMTMCAGVQSCFTINSGDLDVIQNTTVEWDNSISGATFTTYPGHVNQHHFAGHLTTAQISSNRIASRYCRDDNCPYAGTQTYAYCITVTGVNADAGPDNSVACNSTASLTASATGGSGAYTYSWNTGITGPTLTEGGTYIVTVSDGRDVQRSGYALIAPGTHVPNAAFNMAYSCSGLTVQFNDQSTVVGNTIASYAWTFGDGGTSALQNPSHSYTGKEITMFNLLLQQQVDVSILF